MELMPGYSCPPGYKQSEVGVIPKEWDVRELRSLTRSHNSGIYKRQTLYGQGCNIVGVSDIYGIDKVDGQSFAYVPLSVQERTKHTLHANDLLYGESSLVRDGIARTVYVTERGAGTAFAWHTRRYSIEQRMLLSSYLYYYLQSRSARAHMISQSIQTALTGINTVAYFACPIAVPPFAEQEAIAEALSDADALIAAQDRLIAKKRDIKQGAMQQLLTGKTRLPGFGGEWEDFQIGFILAYEQPGDYLVKDRNYSNTGIPVLTAGKTFILGFTNENYGIYTDLPVIVFDDFTTASRYVDFPFKVKSSAIKLLKDRNKIVELRYIFELMQILPFRIRDHKRYYISEYQHIEIQLPSMNEQRAIAEVLSDMDAEIVTLEAQREKARALKQGLMQELLTGKTRLL